jgi:DNA-binding winged helix-turn-helix (wHTH) protein/TolB-like protein
MSAPAVAWRLRRFSSAEVKTGKHLYEFGDFRLDVAGRLLLHGETPLRLPPKVFDTLRILVENSGHVLEKEELLRRVWPDTFVEENSLNKSISLLRKRFGERLADPCFIETVPKVGYRFVALVTERWNGSEETALSPLKGQSNLGAQSEKRLLLSRDLANDTTEDEPIGNKQTPTMIRGLLTMRKTVLGFTMLVVLLALAYHLRLSRRDNAVAAATAPGAATFNGRPSVAVWGFKNLTARSQVSWLSTALSEMLTTELAAGDEVHVIPEEDVTRMKSDLGLPDTDSLSKDTLTRVSRTLGADIVVVGSYTALATNDAGEQIRLDLRMQDARLGETIAAVVETGTEADLFDLVSRSGARLREELPLAPPGTERGSAASRKPGREVFTKSQH